MRLDLKGPVNFLSANGLALPNNRFYYRELGLRTPLKGEWYLSGAIVEAHRAPNNLTDSYMVVEKVRAAKKITIEVPA